MTGGPHLSATAGEREAEQTAGPLVGPEGRLAVRQRWTQAKKGKEQFGGAAPDFGLRRG
jgi:hypothetical protein